MNADKRNIKLFLGEIRLMFETYMDVGGLLQYKFLFNFR